MTPLFHAVYHSPLGELTLLSDSSTLRTLHLPGCTKPVDSVQKVSVSEVAVLQQTASWLDQYFAGVVPTIQLPLAPQGTSFQKLVWQLLQDVPYGVVTSYGELARAVARASHKPRMAAQAIGQAVGRNPIAIIIPCHRVVGQNGTLVGYAGRLDYKQWMLNHEGITGIKNSLTNYRYSRSVPGDLFSF